MSATSIKWGALGLVSLCVAVFVSAWATKWYVPVANAVFANAGTIGVLFGLVLLAVNLVHANQQPLLSGTHQAIWTRVGDPIFVTLRHATTLYVSILVLGLALNRPEVLGIGVGLPQAIVGVAIASPAYASIVFAYGRFMETVAPGAAKIVPVTAPPPPQ